MAGSNQLNNILRLCLITSLICISILAWPATGKGLLPRHTTAGEEWTSTGGPWDPSGDARLFAVDPETEHTVYAVIESSGISTIYRTEDDGATWTSLWQINKRLGALVVRAGILYTGATDAVAGDPAILRSEDAGVTWTTVMTATDSTSINYFDLAPLPISLVYAAASSGGSGLVLSSADGLSWTTRYAISGMMLRVTVNPTNANDIFASGQNGKTDRAEVYRTSDGGDHWSTVLYVAGEDIQDFLQVHPLTTEKIFASIRPRGCCPPEPANLWRSDDGGDTWNVVATGYLFNLHFAPPDSIFSIYDAVSITHDASSPNPTWFNRGVPFSEWLDGRAVDTRGSNPVIYAGLWMSGIYTSIDDAQTFQEANTGIHSLLRANAIATDPLSANTLYVATDKGVFRSDSAGDDWVQTFQRILTHDVAIQPGNSSILLTTVELPSGGFPVPPLVYRSDNSGLNWTLVYSQTEPGINGGYGVTFDTADPDYAYATTYAWNPSAESNNHLLRSDDGGLTWTDILTTHGQVPGVVVIEVALDGTVYLGGKEGFQGDGRAILYRSDDHGDTWTEVYTHDSGWRVLSLSIEPQFPANLMMIVRENQGNTHLLQSNDRGDSWHEVYLESKPNRPRAQLVQDTQAQENLVVITYDPLTAGCIFLGASGPSVNVSYDNGLTWYDVGGWGGAFLAPDISVLAINHAVQDRTLFAGLGGTGITGVWRRSMPLIKVFLAMVTMK